MKYWDHENKFVEFMDQKTGLYIRSGILEVNELTGKMKDTGVDPFMRNYPGLIDVGICGFCRNAELGLCKAGGIDCYQSGKTIKQNHMTTADFFKICEQSKGKVFQIALGGRGDPNKHPQFERILAIARDHGIVPNYTTSGIELTDEEVALTKKYCGAVAVSWQRGPHTIAAIKKFLDAGIKTNIHYVLSTQTIKEAIDLLTSYPGVGLIGNIKSMIFPSFGEKSRLIKKINAIIFLLHKPVGQGESDKVLDTAINKSDLKMFIDAVNHHKKSFKIGFDSCTIPMLVNNSQEHVNMASCDTCEAARFSMYITPDMKAIPCSFDQDKRWAVDLNTSSIQEAWNSTQFESFRDRFRGACPTCKDRLMCLGGCPIKPEVTLCDRKERI